MKRTTDKMNARIKAKREATKATPLRRPEPEAPALPRQPAKS